MNGAIRVDASDRYTVSGIGLRSMAIDGVHIPLDDGNSDRVGRSFSAQLASGVHKTTLFVDPSPEMLNSLSFSGQSSTIVRPLRKFLSGPRAFLGGTFSRATSRDARVLGNWRLLAGISVLERAGRLRALPNSPALFVPRTMMTVRSVNPNSLNL